MNFPSQTGLVRVVRMKFRPETSKTFQAFFYETQTVVASMPGCLFVDLFQDFQDQDAFYTLSLWESEEHLNQYRASDKFGEIWKYTKSLFGAPPAAYSLKPIQRNEDTHC